MERKKGVNSIRHHRNYDFGIVPRIDFKVLVDKNIIRMILWFLVICFGLFCPHSCQIFPPSGEQQRQELQIFLSYDAKKQSGKVTKINNFLLVFY